MDPRQLLKCKGSVSVSSAEHFDGERPIGVALDLVRENCSSEFRIAGLGGKPALNLRSGNILGLLCIKKAAGINAH